MKNLENKTPPGKSNLEAVKYCRWMVKK